MNDTGTIRTALQQICLRDIAFSSLRIAAVVGTILNVINQGGYWLHGEDLHLGHCALNYLVPFCVAAYSAVRTRYLDTAVSVDRNDAC